jgi:hypothetical protein
VEILAKLPIVRIFGKGMSSTRAVAPRNRKRLPSAGGISAIGNTSSSFLPKIKRAFRTLSNPERPGSPPPELLKKNLRLSQQSENGPRVPNRSPPKCQFVTSTFTRRKSPFSKRDIAAFLLRKHHRPRCRPRHKRRTRNQRRSTGRRIIGIALHAVRGLASDIEIVSDLIEQGEQPTRSQAKG